MKPCFTAGMRYDADSIRRLCQVRRDTFEVWKKLGIVAASLLLIVLGLFMSGINPLGILMMLGGSIMLTGVNAPASVLADKILQQFKEKEFPNLQYSFSESGITTNEMTEEFPYTGIVALIEDKDYLYLFQNRLAAFMIDRSTLEGKEDAFRSFLETQTGLAFCEPFKLRSLNLQSFLQAIRLSRTAKSRNKESFPGGRLR